MSELSIENIKKIVIDPFVEETQKECVAIDLEKAECTRIASKLCGQPYLPVGFDYPCVREGEYKGKPLRLLAQINFAEMPPLPDFPEKGILQFYVLDDEVYGMDFDDCCSQNTFRVVFHEKVDENAPQQDMPNDAIILDDGEDYFPVPCELKMNFRKETQAMTTEDFRFDTLFSECFNKAFPQQKTKSVYDLSDEIIDFLIDNTNKSGHRIGGYAYFTQEDPRDNYEAWTTQLLQIDSTSIDDDTEIMWGDCGVANFFIRPDDLRKRDFSHVLYTWDCC